MKKLLPLLMLLALSIFLHTRLRRIVSLIARRPILLLPDGVSGATGCSPVFSLALQFNPITGDGFIWTG